MLIEKTRKIFQKIWDIRKISGTFGMFPEIFIIFTKIKDCSGKNTADDAHKLTEALKMSYFSSNPLLSAFAVKIPPIMKKFSMIEFPIQSGR